MVFKYMLAPMEKFTDNAFRELIYKNSCDLTFTEMARVSSLIRNNNSSIQKTKILNDVPTIIQLLPLKEQELSQYISSFKEENNFQGFNINIGCPSSKLIKLGMGCALVKRANKVSKLSRIIRDAGFNVSIKLRLGMNQFEKENKIYLNLLNDVEADFFIIHGKHGKENEKDPNDFSIYRECVDTGKKIIANGNIINKDQINELRNQNIKGVMIGWGAIKNPNIFNELKNKQPNNLSDLKKEYLELAKKYDSKQENINNILKYSFKN